MNNRNDLSALVMVQIIIILLKTADVTPISSWSWFWVLSTIWIPFVLGVIIIALLKANSKNLEK